MRKFQPPNVPFVEARNVGLRQKPTAIVLTLSQTTSDKGAALGIATRLHSPSAPMNSYHYIVDEAKTYRGVWDNVSAYSSPYRSIDVLVCANPVEDVTVWNTPQYSLVKNRTAELVAQLLLVYKIPVRYLDKEAEERWVKRKSRRRGGIIVRILGEWPSESFLLDVKAQLAIKTS